MRTALKTCTLAVAVALAVGAVPAIGAMTPAQAQPEAEGQEDRVVALVNQTRASRGLAALQLHAGLRTIARRQAQEMAAAGRIYHSRDLARAAEAQGIRWILLGENVGLGANVDEVEDAFNNSRSHFENIVEPDYGFVGVGVVRSGKAVYVAQEFTKLQGAPSSAPAHAAAVRPKAAPAARPQPAAPPPTTAPVQVEPPPRPALAPTPTPVVFEIVKPSAPVRRTRPAKVRTSSVAHSFVGTAARLFAVLSFWK